MLSGLKMSFHRYMSYKVVALYCLLRNLNFIKALGSLGMEPVKIRRFKAFEVGRFAICPFPFTIYMLKSLFCRDILV